MWTVNPHAFQSDDAVVPPLILLPSTFEPSTSHNNNNNNGGLHARVRETEDIEPFLQLTLLVV